MSAKKMRELSEQLDAREKELAGAKARLMELEKRVNDYQARESAIVDALAQAQESARRLLRDAQTQRDELIANAESRLSEAAAEAERRIGEAAAEAERTIGSASAEGESIVARARTEAANLRLGAEAEVENCRIQLAGLKRELAEAAESASRQAERFKAYLGQVQVGGDEPDELLTSAPADAVLPEDYANPSELMRSIYKMQGRDIPDSAAEEELQAEPDEPVAEQQPLYSWGWHTPQGGVHAEEEPPAAEPEPVKAEPDPAEEPAAEETSEDHVWTVDEIIEGELSGVEEAAEEPAVLDEKGAIDLDAIINDIIKMD